VPGHGRRDNKGRTMNAEAIKAAIRDVPDFPKPGILFKDITPILGDAELFNSAVEIFVEHLKDKSVDKIAAIDARGFLFGGAIAARLKAGLVPIRKKGKLPYKVHERSYELEYGTATLTVHQDAFSDGVRVVLFDDLLATGGTAAASAELVEQAGGALLEIDFLVELSFLNGRDKLAGHEIFCPIAF